MTNFEKFKNMNIDGLVEWLDRYDMFEDSPWMKWFDENYCEKCEPITCNYDLAVDKLGIESIFCGKCDCAYCELENHCKFFPDMGRIPTNADIIKIWLELEANDE